MIRFSEYRVLLYALANDTTHEHAKLNRPNYDVETYQHVEKTYALVCYYVTPSRSSSNDRLYPSEIDPGLCTHIIISFATIHNNSIHFPDTDVSLNLEPWKTIIEYLICHTLQIADELLALKKNNTQLKLLLSVVSFSTSNDAFAVMVSSETNRKM